MIALTFLLTLQASGYNSQLVEPPPRQVKLFLWAGQSNCVGVTERGSPDNFPFPEYLQTFHDRYIFHPVWIDEGLGSPYLPYGPTFGKHRGGRPDPPVYTYADMVVNDCGHGADTYFVHFLTDMYRNRDKHADVVILKVGWAAYRLWDHWTEKDGTDSAITRTMHKEILNAAALSLAEGDDVEFVGMGWAHGANDAKVLDAAHDYSKQLGIFINDHVRGFLGDPELPVVLVAPHRWLPLQNFPYPGPVRHAHVQLAMHQKHTGLVDPWPSIRYPTHDGVHFARIGYFNMAFDVFAEFKRLESYRPEHR